MAIFFITPAIFAIRSVHVWNSAENSPRVIDMSWEKGLWWVFVITFVSIDVVLLWNSDRVIYFRYCHCWIEIETQFEIIVVLRCAAMWCGSFRVFVGLFRFGTVKVDWHFHECFNDIWIWMSKSSITINGKCGVMLASIPNRLYNVPRWDVKFDGIFSYLRAAVSWKRSDEL